MTSPPLTKCLEHAEERLKKHEMKVPCVTSGDLSSQYSHCDAGDAGAKDRHDYKAGQILPTLEHGPRGSLLNAPKKVLDLKEVAEK